jgi:hypothetical protein
MPCLWICSLKPTELREIEILPNSTKKLGFQPKSFSRMLNSEFEGSRSSIKMHKTSIHDPTRKSEPKHLGIKGTAAHKNLTKIAWKRHENHSSHKKEIDATMKASIHSEVRFFTKRCRKSTPMEQRNGKQSRWMDCPETLELYIWVPLGWANDQATPST